jgi:hypothetical protein
MSRITPINIYKKLKYTLIILERIRNIDCQKYMEEERNTYFEEFNDIVQYLVYEIGKNPIIPNIENGLKKIIKNTIKLLKLLKSDCNDVKKYDERILLYSEISEEILKLLDMVHPIIIGKPVKKVKISKSANDRKDGLLCKSGRGRPKKQMDNIYFLLENYDKIKVMDGCKPNYHTYITYDFENKQYCCSELPHTEEEMIHFLFVVLESSIKKKYNKSKKNLLDLIQVYFKKFINMVTPYKRAALIKEYTELFNYVIKNDRIELETVSRYPLTKELENKIVQDVQAASTPRISKEELSALRKEMIQRKKAEKI